MKIPQGKPSVFRWAPTLRAVIVGLHFSLTSVALAAPGDLRLASSSSGDQKGNGESTFASLSADGSKVAFESRASNLHLGDLDTVSDILVKDLVTGVLHLVSASSAGQKGTGDSSRPSLSADGTWVAFISQSTNLHPMDGDADPDVYVKNWQTGVLILASVSATGSMKANGFNSTPSLSLDGTRVAFASRATNLDPADGDTQQDIYVKSLTGDERIWLASASSAGVKGNGESGSPSLSADGTVVAFHSFATNLHAKDTDPIRDVYVKDVEGGALTLASMSAEERKGDRTSWFPSLSSSGTKVAFYSDATTLFAGDTNNVTDVYVKDLGNGDIRLASISSDGRKGNDVSFDPSSVPPGLSPDGKRVAFVSAATNLHPADSDSVRDILVRDLISGEVLLASTSSIGTKGNDWSLIPTLSTDGTRVAFVSNARNLDPADTDPGNDVYVKDLPLSGIPLSLGFGKPISLTPARPRELLFFSAPVGASVLVTITDPEPGDANALYVRWGQGASDTAFDQAADQRFQANQRLTIPAAREVTCYVAAQANFIHGASNEVTVLAELKTLALEGLSVRSAAGGPSRSVHAAVLGTGFDGDTVFDLVPGTGGPGLVGSSVLLVSSSRAEMVFDLSAAVPGMHDLRARSPSLGRETRLDGAFEVLGTSDGPTLEVELRETRAADPEKPEEPRSKPRKYRFDRISRLSLRYRNVGDREMTAPLFLITGPPETELGLAREGDLQDGPLQVLGIHPNGVPGKLPPGGGWEIPIQFRSRACRVDCKVSFRVHVLTPLAGAYVGWDDVEHAGRVSMTPADWEKAWPGLSRTLGASWREYGEAMAALSTRLSHRGVNSYSVRKLFRFAVSEALGRPSSAIVGRVTLPGTREPVREAWVLARKSGRVEARAFTDSEGAFAIDGLAPGERYELAMVDHRVLAAGDDGNFVRTPTEEDKEEDKLDVEVVAEPEVNGLSPECPGCDASGLSASPVLPPQAAFTLLAEFPVEIVSSWDPNEKDGPDGEERGVPPRVRGRLVPPGAEMDYTIYFENRPSATAPVQCVKVTDVLDPAIFDVGTVRLRSVQIGNKESQRVELDVTGRELSSGYTRNLGAERFSVAEGFDVTNPSTERLPVTLFAQREKVTEDGQEMEQITWELTALTDDPLEGFLPANCTDECCPGCQVSCDACQNPCTSVPPDATERPCKDGRGEGHVSFSVTLVPNLPEGTSVPNRGKVEFDGIPVDTEPEKPDALTWVNEVSHFSPPRTPHSPEPESGADGVGGDTVFAAEAELSWKAPGAQTCDIFAWLEGASPQRVGSGLLENRFRVTDLLQRRAYRWQVLARNQDGVAMGPEWLFSTGPTCERPPEPVSPDPADGAREVSIPATFTWEPSALPGPGSLVFRVFLWKEGVERPAVATASGFRKGTFAAPLPLEAGTTYRWQVEAFHDGCSLGTAGQPWTFTTRKRFVRGDVDASGAINITDAVFLLNYLFLGGETPPCLEAADANGDGGGLDRPPNISDPVALLNWLFLGGPAPPAPSPGRGAYSPDDCGVDASDESLGCEEFPPCE